MHVMPVLAAQLTNETAEKRRAAVVLLARLFLNGSSASGVGGGDAPFTSTYVSAWSEFLKRFQDADSGIRAAMVRVGAAVL